MRQYLKHFAKANVLTDLINAYFKGVGLESNAAPRYTNNSTRAKVAARKTRTTKSPAKKSTEQDPPTMTGLALHLGFDSLEEFERYENQGKFATHLKRARLLIAAAYEKKLHNSYTSGPIFALKSMGFGEKAESKSTQQNTTMKVVIVESGPKLAENEKEVLF